MGCPVGHGCSVRPEQLEACNGDRIKRIKGQESPDWHDCSQQLGSPTWRLHGQPRAGGRCHSDRWQLVPELGAYAPPRPILLKFLLKP